MKRYTINFGNRDVTVQMDENTVVDGDDYLQITAK